MAETAPVEQEQQSVPSELLIEQELIDEYMRLRENETDQNTYASKIFYFANIFPKLRPYLENRSENHKHRAHGYKTLISMMGFSPETTVSAVAVLKPERLVIAFSEKAADSADIAIAHMTEAGMLRPTAISYVNVDAFDTKDIYNKLLESFQRTPGSYCVDITGGTKVMSATAGFFAWEFNLPIAYLDGNWDPRKGVAGLKNASKLMLIPNPSRQKGLAVRQRALDLYGQRNFRVAAGEFRSSRSKIDGDSDLDWLGQLLAESYRAMADFDMPALRSTITTLKDVALPAGSMTRLLGVRLEEMQARLTEFDALLGKKRLNLMACFLALSQTYRAQGRHDFSVLLSYRGLEELVREGMRRRCPSFDADHPHYDLLGIDDIPKRFHKLAGFSLGDPGEPVGLAGLFTLLCLTRGIAPVLGGEEVPPPDAGSDKQYIKLVKFLKGVANVRNRSILAHGYEPLREDESQELHHAVLQLSKLILKEDDAEFQLSRTLLEPFELSALLQTQEAS